MIKFKIFDFFMPDEIFLYQMKKYPDYDNT